MTEITKDGKPIEPSLTVSQLIKELQELQESIGDVEVFVVNNRNDGTFDGVQRAFGMIAAATNKKYVALIAQGDILKV